MEFRLILITILSYLLVLAPGCRERVNASLSSSGKVVDKASGSYQDSAGYQELKKDNVHQAVDDVFKYAESTFKSQKLTLIRVAPDGGRNIATGGLNEYWSHSYPDHKYYYVDSLAEPSLVLSVKAKTVAEDTIVLELLQHDPQTFGVEQYAPLFIELSQRDKETIIKNVGDFKRALNAFSMSAANRVSEQEESLEPAERLSPETIRKLVTGAIIAAVAGAVGYVIAAALKKQTEGKIQWGIVTGAVLVGIAVYLLVLYSSYEETEEMEVTPPHEPESVSQVKPVISDRTWEFISMAR